MFEIFVSSQFLSVCLYLSFSFSFYMARQNSNRAENNQVMML